MESKPPHNTVWLKGELVRALRRERGWSQQTLAEKSKCPDSTDPAITKRTVEDVEHNRRPVRLATARAIACAFGLQPVQLMQQPPDPRIPGSGPRGDAIPRVTDLQTDELWGFDDVDVDGDGEEAVHERYHSLWWPSIEGTWTSTIAAGAYRLRNTGEKDDRHWIDFTPSDGSALEMLSGAPISVEVLIADSVRSFGTGCGILYRFDGERKRYYTFLLMRDGQVRFALNRESGEKELYKSRSSAIVPGDFNKLTLVADGPEFFLFANDAHVATVENGDLQMGGLGIVASGQGEFAFRNLTIYRRLNSIGFRNGGPSA